MSFTAAAAELNVTPGAISKQIKNLEGEAGCKLFLRLHRTIEFTPEGALLHATLGEAFSRISTTFESLDKARRIKTVSIGSTSAFAQFWLMPRLGRFWKDNQEVVVDHVISDRSHDRLAMSADLRVRYGTPPFAGEESTKLFDDQIPALASPEYAATHSVKSLTDLMAQSLLSVEGVDWTWTTWADFFRAHKVKPGKLNIRRFNSYVIAVQAARDGQGVILGWERLLAPLIAEGALVQIGPFSMDAPQSFHLCRSSGEKLTAEIAVVQKWLLEHID